MDILIVKKKGGLDVNVTNNEDVSVDSTPLVHRVSRVHFPYVTELPQMATHIEFVIAQDGRKIFQKMKSARHGMECAGGGQLETSLQQVASQFVPPDEDNAAWNIQDASQQVEVLLEEVNHDGG